MQGRRSPNRIIIVRHGETRGTEEGRYYGRTDMPLSNKGVKQAEKLCQWLKRYPLNCIYTSPLKRCKQTAAIIKEKKKIPVIDIPEIQEVDFGRWEGLTLTEMKYKYPKKFMLWMMDFKNFKMPDGERVIDMIRRVKKFWKEISSSCQYRNVLVVTHGGPAKVMGMLSLGINMENFWRLRIDTGSVSVIEFEENNYPLVKCINSIP